MSTLISELKRRNVIRVGLAYFALGWVVVQVTSLAVPALNLPESLNAIVFYLGLIGFPFALLITWAFELTPEGIKRTHEVEEHESIAHITGRKLDYIVIGLLSVALLGVVYDSYLSPDEIPPLAIDDLTENTPSIAVLAFENISPDKNQDYFADGISEEILNLLAKTQAMKVAGRTSSFSFKDSKEDIPTIAKKLKVNHVLEGSIRKSGDTLRITAQLIRDDGYHVWSETYDREITDIFKIQDEISAAILSELKVHLLGENKTIEPIHDTTNLDALQKYYMARELIRNRQKESMEYALIVLKDAIALDANYVSAHAQMAIAYLLLHNGQYGDLTHGESMLLAERSLNIAQAIDDNNVDYLAAMGLYHLHTESLNKVVRFLKRALAIQPNHEEALRWNANALGQMGRLKESTASNKSLIDQNPLWVAALNNYADGLAMLGKFEEHNKIQKQIEKLNPTSHFLVNLRANIPGIKGKVAKATTIFLSDPLKTTTPFNKQIAIGNFFSLGIINLVPIHVTNYLPLIYLAQNNRDKARQWAISHSKNSTDIYDPLIAIMTFIRLKELDTAFKVAKETVENNPRLFINNDARYLSCNFGLKVVLLYKHFNELAKVNAVVESCTTLVKNMVQSKALPQILLNAQFHLAVVKDDYSQAMMFLKRFIEYKTLLDAEVEIDWPFYDKLRSMPEFNQTIADINKHKTSEANKLLTWLDKNPGTLDSFFK